MDKQITEGNKLIAEFMGAKKRTFSISNLEYYANLPHGKTFLYEDLQYYTSFGWLMPVVEKILGEVGGSCMIAEHPNYIGDKFWRFSMHDDGAACSQGKSENLIEAVWLAVVEFIKWFNNQKLNS